MNNIRVFYSKLSRAKYISHLDITRCMQRAIKRAGIPVWYTEGFNPHIYMTFALPLSLGYESESESMDIRLIEEMDFKTIMDRLNKSLPPDIRAVSVAEQVNKPDSIVSALYEMTISNEEVAGEKLAEEFEAFMNLPEIVVEKRTKRGMKTVDIKPDCEIMKISVTGNNFVITIKTAAGLEKNINPTLLTDAFFKFASISNCNVSVMKRAVYMANGNKFE